jgi:hypothetical protein
MAPSKSKDAEKEKLTRIALVSDDKVSFCHQFLMMCGR